MTLPANDDFSNRELCTEELDAIAAGFIVGGAFGAGLPHPPPPQPSRSLIYRGARINSLFF